jgi:hypothetical protein
LENPGSFFKDIEKSEIKTIVNEYGYDNLKYPFGKNFSINIINMYKRKLGDNASYSLSTVTSDPVTTFNFQNNFSYGGWNGLLINTQYPENNYMGFNTVVAPQELFDKINGLAQTPGKKIQSALQQGMGFLSPQICAGKNKDVYNNGYNEFNHPSFDQAAFDKDYSPPACDGSDAAHTPSDNGICTAEVDYDTLWYAKLDAKKAEWATKNVCDGPLINTTPGAVVANQITTALNIPENSTLQAMGLGNSLSAIFDALLNKFLTDGLNSLKSTKNSQPPADTWSYNGLTLGSSDPGGVNAPWDTGPDQPIVLSDFKKTVATGLDNTNKELLMMTNDTPNDSGPGIKQILNELWPKTQQLDICQPGPDLGWQDRLSAEATKNEAKLNATGTAEDISAKDLAIKEFQFAVNSFKAWVNIQAMNALPSSANNLDAISDLKNINQELSELANKISATREALTRLQSIKLNLDAITVDPEPGSAEEASLVSLWKQYSGISDTVSNDITMQSTQTELATAKDKSANLNRLMTQCTSERTTKGWSNPGGAASTLSSATEQTIFCDAPVAGGYSHEPFVNPETPTYPRLPLVNAQGVLIGTSSVDVSLSCGTIYRSSALDYTPGY